ncbi:hypothetical protein EBX31_04315 [bacterium]|nr:hypothetical protein [bacterium]
MGLGQKNLVVGGGSGLQVGGHSWAFAGSPAFKKTLFSSPSPTSLLRGIVASSTQVHDNRSFSRTKTKSKLQKP